MSVPTARGRYAFAYCISSSRSFLAAALLAAAALPLVAQQVPAGLSTQTTRVPVTASQALAIPGGLVTFDSGDLVLTPTGQAPQVLFSIAGTVFGSFLLQTDANHVLFAQTGTGASGANDHVWLVPLQGPPPVQPLATIRLNYDGVMLTPTTVLVSARLGGFAVQANDLVVLDLGTGATQVAATLPGASGPVAIAPNGDVFYATASPAFPAPPGTVQVLRFARSTFDAAIATQTVLGIADAQIVWSGIDAASDLAFDDDGDLFFVDWMNSRIGEINDATGIAWMAPPVVDYATASVFPSTLQFVAGAQHGELEPFQPANGSLLVFESDFWSTSQLRAVAGAEAELAVSGGASIPTGPFTIAASNGPSLGLGVLGLAFGSGGAPLPIAIPGHEQLLWLAPAIVTGGPILVGLPFDGSGATSLVVTNPGFAPGLVATTQVAFVSVDGVLGATHPVAFTLGQ